MTPAAQIGTAQGLARRLGLFSAAMLVMGGTIGSGIFMNPTFVARQVHTSFLILAAWIFGGLIAMTGACVYAEISSRLPEVGGQYAYLRTAFHPLLAFLYGWVLLLVVQTGGMAAVTVTFARYFVELSGLNISVSTVAAITLAVLTAVNCLGVKSGSNIQSLLMVLKVIAIASLIVVGLVFNPVHRQSLVTSSYAPLSPNLFSSFGAAMVPVLFAYGGWQTACFVAGELKEPRRDLPRALLLGVIGVIVLYTLVNLICLRSLGPDGLARSEAPASAVMRLAFGETGARLIAFGIVISTLGFLSQSVLTAPRVYFAMARDGVFFRRLAWVHPRTRVPIFAIVLQSLWAILILFSGSYAQILNYVTAMDWIFFGLTAASLFVFRRRSTGGRPAFAMPLHPYSTLFFCFACWSLVANTIYRYPANTLIGIAIMLAGIPVYYFWKRPAER